MIRIWLPFIFLVIVCGGSAALSTSQGIVRGARLSLATAYQSCDALNVPPLTKGFPDVQGIKIIGKHPNGIGDQFVISDLPALLQTQPYIPKNIEPGCRDVRKSPMIYDYGGKPWVTSKDPMRLNFFVDAGSGTSVLGIDCSGFVFSALAAGGLKINSAQDLRANLVNRYGAKSYKEPAKNGMNCFTALKGNEAQPLKAGDLIASSYHVAIVDWADKDPFRFNDLFNESQCSNITIQRAKFTILHSAPDKGGIGIHRSWGPDYVKENFFFSMGMADYMRSACRAHFSRQMNSEIPPIEQIPSAGDPDQDAGLFSSNFFISVTRHRDDAVCKGDRLQLEGQACVEKCPGLLQTPGIEFGLNTETEFETN